MNSLIESLLSTLNVPFQFMFYEGDEDTYITYQGTYKNNSLGADNEVIGYVDYYDVDIYSKGNYFPLMNEVIKVMVEGGFTFQPSRSSSDMYERDTKLFHKSLCFAIEREVIING